MKDELLKVREVCKILSVDRMTFYQLMRRGVLDVIDLNKGSVPEKRPRYRVKASSLTAYIKHQSTN